MPMIPQTRLPASAVPLNTSMTEAPATAATISDVLRQNITHKGL
ncbi:hypothetical protein [Arthrobacter sp. Soil736]|nr:hypothetical protein [Arthrobacter sp. Soil736]